jgi:hypothetical protein
MVADEEVVECFSRGPRDRTQQEWIVRAKILALHRECKCRIIAVRECTDIELPDLVRHRVAIGSGVTAGKAFRSKACKDLHFKPKTRACRSEVGQVLGNDGGVFEFRDTEKIP